jgi:hypothetical protein
MESGENMAQRDTNKGMINGKFWVGSYRHAMPYPKDNLYRRVRYEMRLTQRRAATIFGMSHAAWCYRERSKRMYHLAEIVALQSGSGISIIEFYKILKDCA